MALDAFRQKPFASTLTTTRESGASAFRPHARPKTVLLLARSFGWLISAFHKAEKIGSARIESGYIKMGQGIVNLVGRRAMGYFELGKDFAPPILWHD